MKTPWIDKLKELEVSPPGDSWDAIAASLGESGNELKFARTLFDYTVEPADSNWSKIQEQLEDQPAKVLSITQKKSIPLFTRYAVAACLLGLLGLAIFMFRSGPLVPTGAAIKNSGRHGVTGQDSNSSGTEYPAISGTHPNASADPGEIVDPAIASLEAPSHSFGDKVSMKLYNSPARLASSLSAATMLGRNAAIQYPHRAAISDAPEEDLNRYLMFKDSEGRFIKISKKLTSLFCCVSGEEQDENCNDQLRKWREKIASSSFVPSPDNFMDILDLVSSLEDNRN